MTDQAGQTRWESQEDARVKFEVPNDWTSKRTDDKVMTVTSPDGVAIDFRYVSLGAPEAAQDEHLVMAELKSLVTDIKITNPLTTLHQHGLTGSGLGGSGHRGQVPIAWFSIVFGDQHGHGVIAFCFGEAKPFMGQYQTILKIMGSIQPIG